MCRTPERREAVLLAAQLLLATPSVEASTGPRRCRLPEFEASDPSGASLSALHEVLTALPQFDDQTDMPHLITNPKGETDERQHTD